jgi:hypothetical protein
LRTNGRCFFSQSLAFFQVVVLVFGVHVDVEGPVGEVERAGLLLVSPELLRLR